MIDYTGRKCPVCHQPITDRAQLVVCPDCGAPYHRECWAKAGRCVFSDRHSATFEYRPEEEGPQPLDGKPARAAGERACPACGAQNPEANIFCESCGAPIHGFTGTGAGPRQPYDYSRPLEQSTAQPVMPDGKPIGEIDGIKPNVWSAYLGNSAPYYLMVFQQLDNSRRKAFPCFSALLFGPLYLLYRKVWKWGIAAAAADLLLSVPAMMELYLMVNFPSAQPSDMLLNVSTVFSVLSLLFRLALAFFSFWLVRRDGAARIRREQARAENEQALVQRLQHIAAPGWVGIVIYFAFSALCALLVLMPSLSNLL